MEIRDWKLEGWAPVQEISNSGRVFRIMGKRIRLDIGDRKMEAGRVGPKRGFRNRGRVLIEIETQGR